jgi:hypothetical protein
MAPVHLLFNDTTNTTTSTSNPTVAFSSTLLTLINSTTSNVANLTNFWNSHVWSVFRRVHTYDDVNLWSISMISFHFQYISTKCDFSLMHYWFFCFIASFLWEINVSIQKKLSCAPLTFLGIVSFLIFLCHVHLDLCKYFRLLNNFFVLACWVRVHKL